ncbi:2-dehydro-3-deoxy-phosphogluconate aldolase [Bertholletia excelsa]
MCLSSSSFSLLLVDPQPPRQSFPISSALQLPRRHRTSSFLCCSSTPGLTLSLVDKTLSDIKKSGIIACLRSSSAELAMEAATAALTGGISVLEIVTSTPGVFEVIQQLVKDYPTRTFGVGSVLNAEDAKVP